MDNSFDKLSGSKIFMSFDITILLLGTYLIKMTLKTRRVLTLRDLGHDNWLHYGKKTTKTKESSISRKWYKTYSSPQNATQAWDCAYFVKKKVMKKWVLGLSMKRYLNIKKLIYIRYGRIRGNVRKKSQISKTHDYIFLQLLCIFHVFNNDHEIISIQIIRKHSISDLTEEQTNGQSTKDQFLQHVEYTMAASPQP